MATSTPLDEQPHYHALNTTSLNTRTATSNARHLLPHIKPDYRILDIGCGPGSITADLAELVPQGEIVGIDINPDFIGAGTTLAEKKELGNLSFRVGDVERDLGGPPPLKPNGIFSTIDSAIKLILPTNSGLLSSEATYESLSRSRGADPLFGKTSHITAHEAGFAWEDIETSSWTVPEMGAEGRERIKRNARATAEGFVERGLITAEDAEVQSRGWVEWAGLREGRWFEVVEAVVCWKR